MVISLANTPPSGGMQQRKIILVSNTFLMLTLIISCALFKNIIKSSWTFKESTTVYWPLTRIRKGNMSTFPCQLTSPNPSKTFSILPQRIHTMHCTNGQCRHMAKALSVRKDRTFPRILMKNTPKKYNPRSGHYFTNHKRLIQTCCLL